MAKHKQVRKPAKGPLADLSGTLVLKNIENGVTPPNDPLVKHYVQQGTLSKEQVARAEAAFMEPHRRAQLRVEHARHGVHR